MCSPADTQSLTAMIDSAARTAHHQHSALSTQHNEPRGLHHAAHFHRRLLHHSHRLPCSHDTSLCWDGGFIFQIQRLVYVGGSSSGHDEHATAASISSRQLVLLIRRGNGRLSDANIRSTAQHVHCQRPYRPPPSAAGPCRANTTIRDVTSRTEDVTVGSQQSSTSIQSRSTVSYIERHQAASTRNKSVTELQDGSRTDHGALHSSGHIASMAFRFVVWVTMTLWMKRWKIIRTVFCHVLCYAIPRWHAQWHTHTHMWATLLVLGL